MTRAYAVLLTGMAVIFVVPSLVVLAMGLLVLDAAAGGVCLAALIVVMVVRVGARPSRDTGIGRTLEGTLGMLRATIAGVLLATVVQFSMIVALAGTLLLLVMGYGLAITGIWPAIVMTVAVAGPLLSVPVVALGTLRRSGWPSPSRSVRVDKAAAPALWEVVENAAQAVDAPGPKEVWLIAEANAGVYESYRGLRQGYVRYLCIGVPLLAGIDRAQLYVVLCHEMAHYRRRHIPFIRLAERGSGFLAKVSSELDAASAEFRDIQTVDWALEKAAAIQYRLYEGYTFLYLRLTRSVRRQQELEADRVAANAVGEDALAAALCATDAVAAAWQKFCPACLAPMEAEAGAPDDPFQAFRLLLEAQSTEPVIDEPAPHGSYASTHPTLESRLAAVGASSPATFPVRIPPPGSFTAMLGRPTLHLELARKSFPYLLPGHLDADGTTRDIAVRLRRVIERYNRYTLSHSSLPVTVRSALLLLPLCLRDPQEVPKLSAAAHAEAERVTELPLLFLAAVRDREPANPGGRSVVNAQTLYLVGRVMNGRAECTDLIRHLEGSSVDLDKPLPEPPVAKEAARVGPSRNLTSWAFGVRGFVCAALIAVVLLVVPMTRPAGLFIAMLVAGPLLPGAAAEVLGHTLARMRRHIRWWRA